MAGRRAPRAGPARLADGQHFLRTGSLAEELVRDACVGPADLVLDLGAGTGRLTAALAARAGRVVAVELDPNLARGLRGRWPNVAVVEGDAARLSWPQEPFRVVANVPFGSTTAILRRLLDDPRTPLVRADLVVEWDVARKRAVPWPSTLNGVLWGAWYRFSLARRLPARLFEPPPRVDAGVLVVERRAVPLVAPDASDDYRAFVAAGFRRGVPRSARRPGAAARDLDAHAWAALFRGTAGRTSDSRGGSLARPRPRGRS